MKQTDLVHVAWECPHCGHRHMWRWDRVDAEACADGPIWMVCHACRAEARLVLWQIGAGVWAGAWP
jgi:phage terminase large subunit GpA-like protein